MLDRILHFSIHNKLIIGLLVLALIIWGSYSATRLPIDAVPDITNNQVQVITVSSALAALDIERLVTVPIEQSLKSIPRQVELRSISRFGLSIVTIVFEEDVNLYWARQQVFERLVEAKTQIPAGVGEPALAPISTGLGEIYQYTLRPHPGSKHQYNLTELRSIQDWIVRRGLVGTPGVADVSSFGGYVKQYEVAVDPGRLRSMDVSLDELFTALASNNQNTSGAYIERGPNALFIRTDGLVSSLADIGQIVVRSARAGQAPVLVRDVATPQFGHAVRYGAMTINGKGEGVGGIVLMLKGANSSQVIGAVKARMAEIEKTLPEGLTIEPFLDRTDLVNRAIATVSKNLAEGALIVVFVLVLLLGNWRAGLVVASAIPLSLLFAIGMMTLLGVSGNLMSLGAIDFGLIVDGAVIIVEAIVHRLAVSNAVGKLTRAQMDTEVYGAASRIRNTAAFGEIIILIVYLPILTLEGVEGRMFRPMAQTVGLAILGAFILSLTYVPMMAALVLPRTISHTPNWSDRIMAVFQRMYTPVLALVLRRMTLTIILSVLVFAGSIWLLSTLGGEFIPTLDEGDFAVETRIMTGGSLTETIRVSEQAALTILAEFPEVIRVIGKIGSSEIRTDPMPIEACDLMVILKDRSEWSSDHSREELATKIQARLEQIPGVSYGFQQPIQMRFNELITGARQDVVVKLYGDDLGVLAGYAPQIGAIVQKVAGAEDLYVEQISGLPQIVVTLDRARLAQFGIPVASVNRAINMSFAGQTAGVVYEGDRRFDLVLRLDTSNRQGIENVRSLPIMAASGQAYPLAQLAQVELKQSPNQVQREQGLRRISVGFNVRGRDVQSIVTELQSHIQSELKLPAGYSIEYGGQFQNLAAARARLSIAVPVALVLIFLLLFFTFHSIGQSLLIFTAIPLSAIGGVLALWLRGMPFSISAGIGFIALFGVAVLNGIVLIAEFNHLAQEGLYDLLERVRKGTRTRLRPVITTASVALLGFLPMALSSSAGAEVQRPLATVVIGGLVSATLLTLLVLPVLYVLYTRRFGDVGPMAESAAAEAESDTSKPSGFPPTAMGLLLLLACGAPMALHAQSSGNRLTAEQAVTIALENNLGLKADRLELDVQQQLRRTSSEINPTVFTWTLGNNNSPAFDDNLNIQQTIPWPARFGAQRKLADTRIAAAEIQIELTANRLAYLVRTTYSRAVYHLAVGSLLLRQDSLLVAFVRAATIRYKTGETGALESATAQIEHDRLQSRIRQNQVEHALAQSTLAALLQAPLGSFPLDTTSATRIPALELDSSLSTPVLALARLQVTLHEQTTRLERTRLLPDLTFGYYNQSLTGTYLIDGVNRFYARGDRFQGGLVGIAFPIWARPQLARIQVSRLATQQAKIRAIDTERRLAAQADARTIRFTSAVETARRFEDSVLPRALLLRQTAEKSFRAGEIGYLEYALSLQRALELNLEYLDLVRQAQDAASLRLLQPDDLKLTSFQTK